MSVTYCATCDSPDPCGHTSHRYMEEVVYERLERGWRVSDADRERWENPPKHAKGKAPAPVQEARPVQQLVVEIEGYFYLDDQGESLLRSTYAVNEMKTTRLVDATIEKVKAGELSNPGGFLVSRLRTILDNGNA